LFCGLRYATTKQFTTNPQLFAALNYKGIIIKSIIFSLLLLSSAASSDSFPDDLVRSAIERTKSNVTYDGSYHSIPYPNGDVPKNIGVCTDVVIRAYRGIGIDLQKLVHEDMLANFSKYPSKRIWGLTRTDRNIDHRRVPNLRAFFKRHGESLPTPTNKLGYLPGELVTWMLPGNLPHIGIISDKISEISGNPMVVHNIGAGPVLQDMLFKYKITGHYLFYPPKI
jgi:uncharacterized protein YijF (DUF1287 family)